MSRTLLTDIDSILEFVESSRPAMESWPIFLHPSIESKFGEFINKVEID